MANANLQRQVPQYTRRPWKQPQIHLETFRPVRRFNYTSITQQEFVEVGNGNYGNASGGFTVACLYRPTTAPAGAADMLVARTNTSTSFGIELNTSGFLSIRTTAVRPSTIIPTIGTWCLSVVCKGGGAGEIARYGHYANGAWTLENDALAVGLADPPSVANNIQFAKLATNYMQVDLAVAAIWTQKLTDGQIQNLSVNQATSDWSADVLPAGLWQFNQPQVAPTMPVDDIYFAGDQQTMNGTEVVFDGPAGWTYLTNPVREWGVPTLIRHRQLAAA